MTPVTTLPVPAGWTAQHNFKNDGEPATIVGLQVWHDGRIKGYLCMGKNGAFEFEYSNGGKVRHSRSRKL